MKISSLPVIILSLAVLPACNTTSPERCEQRPGKPYMGRACSPGHEGRAWKKQKRLPPLTYVAPPTSRESGQTRSAQGQRANNGKN